jgi:hypothetical protein
MTLTPTKPVRTRPLLGLVALAVAGIVALPTAAGAQESPTTTTPELLVPGDTTPTTAPAAGAQGSTVTSTPAEDGGLFDLDVDASTKVWIIVGGLVGVAVLIAALTVIYWRHTRPERPEPEPDAPKKKRRRKRWRRRRGRDDDGDSGSPPLDLDDLLGLPDPGRSVFASESDES